MIVYLGGTISKNPLHLNWRGVVAAALGEAGHLALTPMRGKDPDKLSKDGLTSDIDPMLFCDRDRMDVRNSDVIVSAFFYGLQRQSLGTWVEAGWAIEQKKPWLVYTDDLSVRGHPFVRKWASLVVDASDPDGLKKLVGWIKWLAAPPAGYSLDTRARP